MVEKGYFIARLPRDGVVTFLAMAREKELKPKRNGGVYLHLALADRTGEVDGKIWELGVHLTQVTATYSMAAHAGLSPDLGGIRSVLYDREGLPGLSVPAALAGGLPVSALWAGEGMAAANDPAAVRRLPPSDLGDGRYDFPGYA